MSKKSLALLYSKGKSKSPVEDTVRLCWNEILIGAANGHSRAAIRKILEAAGHHVGNKDGSGFNAALARVATELGVVIGDTISDGGQPAPNSTARTFEAQRIQSEARKVPTDTHDDCPPMVAHREQADSGGTLASTVDRRSRDATEGNGNVTSNPPISPFADDRFTSSF